MEKFHPNMKAILKETDIKAVIICQEDNPSPEAKPSKKSKKVELTREGEVSLMSWVGVMSFGSYLDEEIVMERVRNQRPG